MKWRRYRTKEGACVETYEVPATVLRQIGPARLKHALAQAERTNERSRRNALIHTRLRDGWKPLAVASEFGLSEAMVRRIRSQMK